MQLGWAIGPLQGGGSGRRGSTTRHSSGRTINTHTKRCILFFVCSSADLPELRVKLWYTTLSSSSGRFGSGLTSRSRNDGPCLRRTGRRVAMLEAVRRLLALAPPIIDGNEKYFGLVSEGQGGRCRRSTGFSFGTEGLAWPINVKRGFRTSTVAPFAIIPSCRLRETRHPPVCVAKNVVQVWPGRWDRVALVRVAKKKKRNVGLDVWLLAQGLPSFSVSFLMSVWVQANQTLT